MIIIVDYGMGNLGSVFNMFKKIGVQAKISNDLEEISKAEKILLPGVGSFDAAIKKINEVELMPILNFLALEKKIPVLGICLGMQLLMESSEEGSLPGFGWVKGAVKSFKKNIPDSLKVPHMGWNDVVITRPNPLSVGFSDEIKFYFVHSYFVKVEDMANQIMSCNYGIDFDAAIQKDNIFGAQFHPEKSHRFGMKLLKNFSNL
jgi:glutamine amidotransferase